MALVRGSFGRRGCIRRFGCFAAASKTCGCVPYVAGVLVLEPGGFPGLNLADEADCVPRFTSIRREVLMALSSMPATAWTVMMLSIAVVGSWPFAERWKPNWEFDCF